MGLVFFLVLQFKAIFPRFFDLTVLSRFRLIGFCWYFQKWNVKWTKSCWERIFETLYCSVETLSNANSSEDSKKVEGTVRKKHCSSLIKLIKCYLCWGWTVRANVGWPMRVHHNCNTFIYFVRLENIKNTMCLLAR
jgi:hypothetical protein